MKSKLYKSALSLLALGIVVAPIVTSCGGGDSSSSSSTPVVSSSEEVLPTMKVKEVLSNQANLIESLKKAPFLNTLNATVNIIFNFVYDSEDSTEFTEITGRGFTFTKSDKGVDVVSMVKAYITSGLLDHGISAYLINQQADLRGLVGGGSEKGPFTDSVDNHTENYPIAMAVLRKLGIPETDYYNHIVKETSKNVPEGKRKFTVILDTLTASTTYTLLVDTAEDVTGIVANINSGKCEITKGRETKYGDKYIKVEAK